MPYLQIPKVLQSVVVSGKLSETRPPSKIKRQSLYLQGTDWIDVIPKYLLNMGIFEEYVRLSLWDRRTYFYNNVSAERQLAAGRTSVSCSRTFEQKIKLVVVVVGRSGFLLHQALTGLNVNLVLYVWGKLALLKKRPSLWHIPVELCVFTVLFHLKNKKSKIKHFC